MHLQALLSFLPALASTWAPPLPDALDLPDRPQLRAALERIATRTGTSLARQSWPLATWEARAFLREAQERDSLAITRADSLALGDLLGPMKALAHWERPGGTMLDVHLRGTFTQTVSDTTDGASDHRRLGTLGGLLQGSLAGQLHFATDAWMFTEWADDFRFYDRYPEADGEPSGVPFDQESRGGLYKERTGSRYTAYALWKRDWITLKYGYDHLQMGPGEWTGLTTRRQGPPYIQLDTRVAPFDWLSVQAVLAQCRQADLWRGRTFDGNEGKWSHIHRFELHPLRGLALAFQNEVLYKDSSGVDPAYLLPIVPIFITQDLKGNRDNSSMQFDVRLDRIPHTSLWSAVFLDDLNSLSDFFGSHWLNRWAFLAGGRLTSPWPKVADADLTVEWSVVRPWTYTGGREAAYSFQHYGLPMGSELGPDSRTFHARLDWRIHPRASTSLEAANLEKGTGRQATLGIVHTAQDPQHSHLLSGEIRETRTLGLHARFIPWGAWRDLSLELGTTRHWQLQPSRRTFVQWDISLQGDW